MHGISMYSSLISSNKKQSRKRTQLHWKQWHNTLSILQTLQCRGLRTHGAKIGVLNIFEHSTMAYSLGNIAQIL